jgi:nuclear pore complex protein Nup155
VVSDHGRNFLYTLSSNGSISIYKPGGDKSVQHIQTISNLYKAVQDRAPGYPALTPQNFQIISLHVVEPSESRYGIQFFAITSSGVRLYLPQPDAPPSSFRPSATAYGASQPPSQSSPPSYAISSLESTCYTEGLTIGAQQGSTDGTDYILCMAPDLTRIGNLGQLNIPPSQISSTSPQGNLNDGRVPLTEYATLLSIPGRTWALAAVPRISFAPALPEGVSPAALNELAAQFGGHPRQFMLLTNVGLTFLIKRRALDYLRAVLEELHSEGSVQPIIEFRDRLVVLVLDLHRSSGFS